jgi:hypothetical protein
MYALEHLAWGVFYGLTTIFMGLAMEGGRLETWIRWLFITGGALSLLHVAGIVIASPALIDLGYFAAGVLLPFTTTLLAVWRCADGKAEAVRQVFTADPQGYLAEFWYELSPE